MSLYEANDPHLRRWHANMPLEVGRPWLTNLYIMHPLAHRISDGTLQSSTRIGIDNQLPFDSNCSDQVWHRRPQDTTPTSLPNSCWEIRFFVSAPLLTRPLPSPPSFSIHIRYGKYIGAWSTSSFGVPFFFTPKRPWRPEAVITS